MTYDRAIVKLPDDAAALHARLYEPPPIIWTLVPASDDEAQTWRYTSTRPTGEWSSPDFDDSGWAGAPEGFSRSDTPRARIGTVWDTSRLWLRHHFDLPARPFVNPHLRLYHDGDVDVYVNGVIVATLPGYTGGYRFVPLGVLGDAVLVPGESNLLAVYVSQTRGSQFIDVGVVNVIER